MALALWNSQWLNLNASRQYPLADDANGEDTTGAFRLPDDFLVEADLPVSAGNDVNPGRFFVLHVGVYGNGYSVIIGYQPLVGDPVSVASALIPEDGFTENSVYSLTGGSNFEDSVGKVVIGSLSGIREQPPGFWTFSLENARLDPDAVRPIVRGVSSISCITGETQSNRLTGDLVFRSGSNFQLSVVQNLGEDPEIIFSAIDGEGTIESCVCAGAAESAEPIRRILGISGTSTNDFNIIGSSCLTVTPLEHGIRLTNTCAQPCCGCPELEVITQDLTRLEAEAASVREFANELRVSAEMMDKVVLATRIRDRGCVN